MHYMIIKLVLLIACCSEAKNLRFRLISVVFHCGLYMKIFIHQKLVCERKIKK